MLDAGSVGLAIWAVGAMAGLLRIGFGLFRLKQFVGSSEPVEGPVRRSLTQKPCTAIAFGIRKPIVLLPRESTDWPVCSRQMVILHELAHVRRHDFATNLVAELACAIYWFNPLVWLGARAMRGEAESAADNEVLLSGVLPSDYASELLRMAADLARCPGHPALIGASPMVQARIEARLARILSSSTRRRGVTVFPALVALGSALLISAGVAGMRLAPKVTTSRAQLDQLVSPEKEKFARSLATTDSLLIGRPDAPVKVISFFDYECPSCRMTAKQVEEAVAKSKDIALYIRLIALPNHKLARPAAMVAIGARSKGDFPAVHHALLGGPTLSQKTIDAAANKFGLSSLTTWEPLDKLRQDRKSFSELGLRFVPSFLVIDSHSVQAYGSQELLARLQRTDPLP